jgi:hypothetical protein
MGFPAITERPGSESATGLGLESVFGESVSVNTFLPMTSNTMEADPGWFSPGLMMGTRDRQVFNLYGEAKYSGAIEGPLFPTNAIQLIVAAIGVDAVTGSGPYTHTLSQSNSLPSLTVEKNIGGYQSLTFAGCRVGKLSVKAPVGNEPVTVSADLMGQSVAVTTSPTAVSVVNEMPFVFSEASVTLDSHARADVTNISFDIDNGLKETYTYSGNHGPSFLTPVTVKASGTFDVVWSSLNDSTYGDFNTMQNETLGALAVSFAHPGGSAYSVGFTFPQVALVKVGADVKLEDVVMSTIAFEASKSISLGYTLQAAVINGASIVY